LNIAEVGCSVDGCRFGILDVVEGVEELAPEVEGSFSGIFLGSSSCFAN
jgi:hypothetical protein